MLQKQYTFKLAAHLHVNILIYRYITKNFVENFTTNEIR